VNGSAIRTNYATGLDENTKYEFEVLAFASAGDGPTSSVKVMRTVEDGKNTCFVFYCCAVFKLEKHMVATFFIFSYRYRASMFVIWQNHEKKKKRKKKIQFTKHCILINDNRCMFLIVFFFFHFLYRFLRVSHSFYLVCTRNMYTY